VTARTRDRNKTRLRVDFIACDGRGLCAELLPELIALDDWGFPIVSDQPIPDRLLPDVRVAVQACPLLALSEAVEAVEVVEADSTGMSGRQHAGGVLAKRITRGREGTRSRPAA
jgi:ferredoxin